MAQNTTQKGEKQDKFLTLRDLASFTDEVLLPGVERIVKNIVTDVVADIVTDVVTDVVTDKVGNVEHRVGKLETRVDSVEQEIVGLRKDMNAGFESVNEKLDDLKASANTLDDVLEQHPIPRIERLEQHAHLPPYVHTFTEE